MPSVKRVRPETETFITIHEYLRSVGKLPDIKTLAEILGYKSYSSISDMLAKRLNIRPDALAKFMEYFNEYIPDDILNNHHVKPSDNIYRNIKIIREYLGLTQTNLGEKVGASKTMIQSYEAGRAFPKMIVLEKIAAMIGLPISKISFGEVSLHDMNKGATASIPTKIMTPLEGLLIDFFNDAKKDLSVVKALKESAAQFQHYELAAKLYEIEKQLIESSKQENTNA